MDNYICIHAHFYQPPRENPWIEAIEYQPSAFPYHDWNRRVTAECYHPNGVSHILDKNGLIERIVNNYSGISFDFGPTLLSWLEVENPPTYSRIIEADRESRERFSGHGSALAQAYNHAILPLCNRRDKITQIRWGIADFSRRFGRLPEGMWIPETAVDLETLDLMAQMGLKFAILAPRQAKRVRKRGERAWHSISNQDIDPSMAYEIGLPSGRRMALFFYDGPISLAVGFEKLLSDGGSFVDRLLGAFSAERKWPQIVHIATDGETFGHHHRFGDMALAYALSAIESGTRARLTNYGEFLERHPPTYLVDICENTSWSCPHEIGRWREDCGCNTGAHPGWQQKWRAPLRAALDWLRDHLEGLYDNDAARFVKDPWAARDDYIDVILDRSPGSVERFLAGQQAHELNAGERVRVLKLLELQRHAQLMYTSCGWFFDDLSGIETIQILQYAGRAIQLGEELFGENSMESTFCDLLQKAPGNDPELKNGRAVYQKFIRPAMVDREKAAGHYAVRLLFQDYPERSEFYSYIIDRKVSKTVTSGMSRLAAGRCRIASKITSESSEFEYAAVHSGDQNISGGARECAGEHSELGMIDAMVGAFEKADWAAVSRLIDEHFGQSTFSLQSLLKDEQRMALDTMLKSIDADLEEVNRQAFERTAPLMRFPLNLGLALPRHFLSVAAAVLNSQLQRAFQAQELGADQVMDLLQDAKFWRIELDKEGLECALRETIEKLAQKSRDNPGDLPSLRNFAAAVQLTAKLPFTVNLFETQNIYYDLFKGPYPELKAAATRGEKNAGKWIEEFKELGTRLSFKID